jgi:hypothetical protein
MRASKGLTGLSCKALHVSGVCPNGAAGVRFTISISISKRLLDTDGATS